MQLHVRVEGRPAPQGSHEIGANGYVMHSSNYLDAWRHAVKRDTFRAYITAGYTGGQLPLIARGTPVHLSILHIVGPEQCRAAGTEDPTGAPDVDKLLRATIDGLGAARVFADDSQVVFVATSKIRGDVPGAIIKISDEPDGLGDAGENDIVGDQSFTPNGQYRLVLEQVSTDGEGDRSWQTVVEVTDTSDAIRSTWLGALAGRLGATSVTVSADAGEPQTAAEATADDKPKRTRRTKAEIEAERLASLAVPQPETPAEPMASDTPPAEVAPARFNPFAKQ